MHRDIYDIAEQYGKDTFLMIDKLGTDKMPFFFTLKGRTDAMLEKSKIFPSAFHRPRDAEIRPSVSQPSAAANEKLAR
ncbi:D-lactate dehydrogenase [Salmonella enterica subsp. enterica]|nr:D-lactate dehydrogenase [Salmonella enterica subsp. enterica]